MTSTQIPHAQRLAGGVRKRERGRLQRGLVEIARSGRVRFLHAIRQETGQQARHRVEQADEDDGRADVEGDVERRNHLCKIRLPGMHVAGDRAQERQNQRNADDAVDEIADRQAIARGIVTLCAFEHRIDGAAEIGPEHQRRIGRYELRIGQRHDQQHAGDARMHRPGEECGDDDAQNRIACYRRHHDPHTGRVLRRRQRVEQDMQRQQHQPETDAKTADILDPRARAGAEGNEAEHEQHGGNCCDIE